MSPLSLLVAPIIGWQAQRTLDELVKATGWLPHTTRAAMTGLKKKGQTIERDKRGEVSCYRITKSA